MNLTTFTAFFLAFVLVTPTLGMPGGANETCPVNYICYAIDQSGSIGPTFYPTEQQFVIDLSREISRRTSNANFSAFGFSTVVTDISTSTTNLPQFEAAILASTVGGGTNIGIGFEACFDELQSQGSTEDNKILVLITDGNGSNQRAIDLRPQALASNIDIITVGIGNGIDDDFLKDLATNENFFLQSDFNTLLEDAIKVVDLTCMVITMSPLPMTPTPPPMTPTPVVGSCANAYLDCDFSFANGPDSLRTFALGNFADRPFTTAIVSKNKNETLGVVNMNGFVPEFIGDDGVAVPINVAGAQPQYTPTHFKPYVFNNSFASGVGHQTFHGNQMAFAKGKCIRLSFSHYQTLKSVQPLIIDQNFNNVAKGDDKCVVFRIGN